MISCEEHLKNIQRCNSKLQELLEEMERAGIGTKGDYQNQILNEEKNIEFYQNQYAKCIKAKSPDELEIYFYVLVLTKDKIRSHIDTSLFNLFEEDRYHETEQSQWKPFKSKPNIDELLSDVKSKYNISPIYLDEIPEDMHWMNFENKIESSISIIDLFSIKDKNKEVALKFDSTKCGVIMPLCRSLNEELVKVANSVRSSFHSLNIINRQIPCDCYAFNLSDSESFTQHLVRILRLKFPIKNQSSTSSKVRDLNMSFQ